MTTAPPPDSPQDVIATEAQLAREEAHVQRLREATAGDVSLRADGLEAQLEQARARARTAEARAQALVEETYALRQALRSLLGWADAMAKRAGVRMGDPNTGAREAARAALSPSTAVPPRDGSDVFGACCALPLSEHKFPGHNFIPRGFPREREFLTNAVPVEPKCATCGRALEPWRNGRFEWGAMPCPDCAVKP